MENMSIKDFTNELSAKKPVPGGGGVAALAGVLSAALSSMVVNYTLGKKRYVKYNDKLEKVINKSIKLRDELINLINEDAKAFEPLSIAYKLLTDTGTQKTKKNNIMEKALVNASKVPMNIAVKSCEVIILHKELLEIGSKIVLSDIGVGAILALSALKSAVLNIYINTKLMKDKEMANKLNRKANDLAKTYTSIAEYTYNQVTDQILE